jgi:nitroreductase
MADQGAGVARAFVALLRGQRSVREGFEDRPVADDVLEDVLACGLTSPSSKNAQPWRLHVVDEQAELREVARLVRTAAGAPDYVPVDPVTGTGHLRWTSTVQESAAVLDEVPVAIFIENRGEFSGGRSVLGAATPENLRMALTGYAFEVLGLGACIQRMWLAAGAHGLQGVFMGDVVVAEDAIAERLGLEGDLVGVLALGYAPAAPERSRTLLPDRVVRHRSD